MGSIEVELDDDVRDLADDMPSTWQARPATPPSRMPAGTLPPPPLETPADKFERLEAVYRQQGRWTELVEVLLERSESTADVEPQIQILHDIAKIYEHELGDQESALCVLEAAFNRDATHDHTAQELERLARATSHWQVLREALQRQAELEPWAENKSALYLRLAEATETDDIDGAVRAYHNALVHAPASVEALEALVRLYRQTEAWQPLAETLSRLAELATDAAERARSWLEIGSIWEQRVFDAGEAIAAYERARELEPSSLAALRALEGLYDTSSQHDRYVETLEAQLVASRSDADRVAIYERMAVAWEERLGNLDRAADAYEKMLALDPRNPAAYHLLARVYRQASKFEALVETYRNHVAATPDVPTQIELYVAMGQAYETQLHDVESAIQAYNDALSLDRRELRALDGLARLYDDVGAWAQAIDVLGRLVDLDDTRTAQLYCRMGRIQATELGDAGGAEASLLRGLASDPGHTPTLEALTTHYEQHGDWLKAVEMMMRAESQLPLVLDKVRLSCAAANICMRELGDDQRAKQLYATVIALDPEHVDAGRPLADLYFAARQWSELSPVIEMLCRKIGQRDPDPKEHGELLYRAARCADELGDVHKALGHYSAACDLDPTHLPTLIGRADLLFKIQDWRSAGKLYHTIVIEQGELDEASVVRIYCRLGAIHQALGDHKRALGMFVKALELDPRHREALQAVIDLQTQQRDWKMVVLAKRGLVETADEVGEKTRLLTEIGTHCQGSLHDPAQAAVAYVEALELAPDNHQVLQKLLDLWIDSKQWNKALEVIERFVVLERDPFHRGVYLHAAATLCRDELGLIDEAVDYYACALDSFFAAPERLDEQQLARALKSFEAIDKILTTKRDWKAQERAYRDMINRLPKGGDPRFYELQLGLIDGLAEIYRSRLKQHDEAIAAFEIAQQMDPDNKRHHANADRAEILAELYVMAGSDHADKAIEQHARVLRREPFNYDAYQALARIYRATSQWDKFWCVCRAMEFLHKADPEQRRFVEQYKPRGFVKAKHVMSPASWAKLAHSDENRYISAVLGACSRSVTSMKGFPHKELGLRREDRRQLQGDSLMFSKLFVHLAQVLNVPVPDVYLVDDDKAVDIQLANALEKHEPCPSFVVRPHVLQGKSEREIAFLLTRRLTFMRPEYYLHMLLPTHTELKVVMLSAIVMLQPKFPVPPNLVGPIQQYVPEMRKRMPPQALEQLGTLVERLIQATPEINLAKWGHAVDAVAHRAGFAMCGDLDVAARAVVAEPIAIDGPTRKDKVKELVLFAVSEDYFAVRAQMELTIAG